MIYQYDSSIEEIRKWGCYFCCLGIPAERHSGKGVTDDILTDAYHRCVRQGYMRQDCYVLDPESVIKVFAGLLEVPIEAQLLYKFKNGKKVMYKHPDKWNGNANFFVSYFVIDKDKDGKFDDESNGHFIETTGSGRIVFDPLKNSKAAKTGEIYSARCFWIGLKDGM